MKRAVMAAAGTVLGLVALLSYKSSGTTALHPVSVGGTVPPTSNSGGGPAATTSPGATPTTTLPSGTSSTGTTPPATSGTTAGVTAARRDYAGQLVDYQYGDIEVEITVSGKRIVNITIPQNDATDPRSQMINSQAVPILQQEALAAQGLNFDAVSGATFTSDAFAQSFETALRKAAL